MDETAGCRLSLGFMRPVDVQAIGNELAVKWDDGNESFVPLEKLRRGCPCAGCKGEVDVLGNLYKSPDRALPASAFELVRFSVIGSYAIQPVWADGHSSGIFPFEYLHRMATSGQSEE